jgi:multidrug efflux pump subunit AcrB
VITIRATYEGAAPETIDTQVTRVLEGAASRVPGVKAISSTSESGSSRIVVEFDESSDLNIAASDLRDAVGNAEPQLPDEVEDLSIVKADDNSDAIIRLAVPRRACRSRISQSSSRTALWTGLPRLKAWPM